MGLEIIAELEDRVKINIHLSNGSNIPDEDISDVVLYSSIPTLSEPPSFTDDENLMGDGNQWLEFIYIPKIKRKLAYHFMDWQETSFARMQSLQGGPYLVKDEPEYTI